MEYLRIKVIPKSSRNEVAGLSLESTEFGDQTTVRIKIKAVPEKGKANKELIEFLAELLNISKSEISIISGAGSQLKLVKVEIPNALAEISKHIKS